MNRMQLCGRGAAFQVVTPLDYGPEQPESPVSSSDVTSSPFPCVLAYAAGDTTEWHAPHAGDRCGPAVIAAVPSCATPPPRQRPELWLAASPRPGRRACAMQHAAA